MQLFGITDVANDSEIILVSVGDEVLPNVFTAQFQEAYVKLDAEMDKDLTYQQVIQETIKQLGYSTVPYIVIKVQGQ